MHCEFLELDPQSKLNFTGIDSETGDLPKIRVTEGRSWIAKLRMVPNVEHLSAEFKLRGFCRIPTRMASEPRKVRDFENGQVPVVDP